jgi:hypothetical protein
MSQGEELILWGWYPMNHLDVADMLLTCLFQLACSPELVEYKRLQVFIRSRC